MTKTYCESLKIREKLNKMRRLWWRRKLCKIWKSGKQNGKEKKAKIRGVTMKIGVLDFVLHLNSSIMCAWV